MRKFFIIMTLLAITLAFLREGNFDSMLILTVILFFCIIPAILFMACYTIWNRCKNIQSDWLITFWRVIAITVWAIVLSVLLGKGMHHWRERETRAYVEKAVAVLDEIHRTKGSYPISLPIDKIGKPPKWLKGNECTLTPDSFYFSYSDPSRMMSLWEYSSNNRKWVEFD